MRILLLVNLYNFYAIVLCAIVFWFSGMMPFSLLPNPLNYTTECPLTPMEAGHSSKNRSALRNPIFSFPSDGQRRLRWVVRRPSSTKKGLLLRKSEIVPTAGNSLAQVHNTRDLRIRARWGATRRTTSFAERESDQEQLGEI